MYVIPYGQGDEPEGKHVQPEALSSLTDPPLTLYSPFWIEDNPGLLCL